MNEVLETLDASKENLGVIIPILNSMNVIKYQ